MDMSQVHEQARLDYNCRPHEQRFARAISAHEVSGMKQHTILLPGTTVESHNPMTTVVLRFNDRSRQASHDESLHSVNA